MHSMTGAKAPRAVVPPRTEVSGIPDIPYSSLEAALSSLKLIQ